MNWDGNRNIGMESRNTRIESRNIRMESRDIRMERHKWEQILLMYTEKYCRVQVAVRGEGISGGVFS